MDEKYVVKKKDILRANGTVLLLIVVSAVLAVIFFTWGCKAISPSARIICFIGFGIFCCVAVIFLLLIVVSDIVLLFRQLKKPKVSVDENSEGTLGEETQ